MRGVRKPYEETHKLLDDIEYKLCNKCNQWFTMSEVYYYKNSKNKIDGFYPYCKKCAIKSASKRKKENYEELIVYKRNWHKKNKENQNQLAKIWKINNKELNKKIQMEWRINNKDKVREYNEHRKMNKNHEISKKEWVYCKEYFNSECAYCGLPSSKHYITYRCENKLGDFHKEHVDHNGNNDLSNCVPSCKSCNVKKHTFSLNEWYNKNNEIYSIERYNKIFQWLERDYKKYIAIK